MNTWLRSVVNAEDFVRAAVRGECQKAPPFQLRFLSASYPQIMGKVLGIVYRTLATHITKKAGYNIKTAQTGAVTLIQRFGSALNLNIHFHIL
jgi:hypothetical protein